jgi:hypothetical protein
LRQNSLTGVHMTVRFPQAAASIIGLLFIAAVKPLYATGYMTAYSANLKPGTVYKSVDASGNVTYSSARPQDSIAVEKITLQPGPSEEYIQKTRRRHERIMDAANELADAREQRQTEREEEEMKRLERLALQRSARPPVYERRVYVGWSPFWRPYPPVDHYPRYPRKYPSHPIHRPGLSAGIPLSTSPRLRH